MPILTNSRRQFIQKSLLGASTLVLPWALKGSNKAQPLRIGICADPHKDIMHDADHRLQVFIDRMKNEKVDFIIQMGDFCFTDDRNLDFLRIWGQFKGPRYHVLGNHDMEDNPGLDVSRLVHTREEVVAFWGMKAKYYSFDSGGYHFVVLDGNEHNPQPWTGYFRYIGPEQLEWLKKDLAQTNLTTIVFSHQSLENFNGIDNREEVRKVLEEANSTAGHGKVVACFSGHHHIDYHTQINGIYYLQVVRCNRLIKYSYINYNPAPFRSDQHIVNLFGRIG